MPLLYVLVLQREEKEQRTVISINLRSVAGPHFVSSRCVDEGADFLKRQKER